MERVIFDTDLYIDWLREGAREELLVGASFLVNDCLIALSSHQIGATVFTHNGRDFARSAGSSLLSVSSCSDWFAEGFDTKNLQEAKALLKEVSI